MLVMENKLLAKLIEEMIDIDEKEVQARIYPENSFNTSFDEIAKEVFMTYYHVSEDELEADEELREQLENWKEGIYREFQQRGIIDFINTLPNILNTGEIGFYLTNGKGAMSFEKTMQYINKQIETLSTESTDTTVESLKDAKYAILLALSEIIYYSLNKGYVTIDDIAKQWKIWKDKDTEAFYLHVTPPDVAEIYDVVNKRVEEWVYNEIDAHFSFADAHMKHNDLTASQRLKEALFYQNMVDYESMAIYGIERNKDVQELLAGTATTADNITIPQFLVQYFTEYKDNKKTRQLYDIAEEINYKLLYNTYPEIQRMIEVSKAFMEHFKEFTIKAIDTDTSSFRTVAMEIPKVFLFIPTRNIAMYMEEIVRRIWNVLKNSEHPITKDNILTEIANVIGNSEIFPITDNELLQDALNNWTKAIQDNTEFIDDILKTTLFPGYATYTSDNHYDIVPFVIKNPKISIHPHMIYNGQNNSLINVFMRIHTPANSDTFEDIAIPLSSIQGDRKQFKQTLKELLEPYVYEGFLPALDYYEAVEDIDLTLSDNALSITKENTLATISNIIDKHFANIKTPKPMVDIYAKDISSILFDIHEEIENTLTKINKKGYNR